MPPVDNVPSQHSGMRGRAVDPCWACSGRREGGISHETVPWKDRHCRGCFLCIVGDQAFGKSHPVRPNKARTQLTQQMPLGVCNPGPDVVVVPGIPTEEWDGEGNTTHAGLNLVESCIGVTGFLPSGLVQFAGRGSGTAANGDIVYFDIVSGLSDANCASTFTIEFVGGTGRFEQASGSADCVSVRTTSCGPFAMSTCAGSISY